MQVTNKIKENTVEEKKKYSFSVAEAKASYGNLHRVSKLVSSDACNIKVIQVNYQNL